MDTAGLRRAYDAFLDELVRGGFGPPPPGEWTAEQVAAHVHVNDELLAQTTEGLLAGSPYAYYNHDAVHGPQLDAVVAEAGGLTGLVDRVRHSSAVVCRLAERLGPEAAATPVATHIRDGDRIVVDEPLPWGRVLDIHQRVHLPAHTDQVRALRSGPGGAPDPSGH